MLKFKKVNLVNKALQPLRAALLLGTVIVAGSGAVENKEAQAQFPYRYSRPNYPLNYPQNLYGPRVFGPASSIRTLEMRALIEADQRRWAQELARVREYNQRRQAEIRAEQQRRQAEIFAEKENRKDLEDLEKLIVEQIKSARSSPDARYKYVLNIADSGLHLAFPTKDYKPAVYYFKGNFKSGLDYFLIRSQGNSSQIDLNQINKVVNVLNKLLVISNP